MPCQNAAACSRKQNAIIACQKKADVAMAEVPSSNEDASTFDSVVDYQMEDRNPSVELDNVAFKGTATEEEEESDVEPDEPEQMESALQHFTSVLTKAQETALAFKTENRKRGHYAGNSKWTQERNRQKSRLL